MSDHGIYLFRSPKRVQVLVGIQVIDQMRALERLIY
jgi:hypothetical protein